MRVFISWANPEQEMNILFNAIQNAGHEIVYWVGEDAGKEMTPPGAIFHDHYEAWAGKPATAFSDVSFTPLSSKRLSELHTLESTILTMMNKRYDSSPVEERKQIYYDMLAQWTYVLDKVRPDAIVFTTVPHSIYDYIIYSLARERGLKTLMFEDSWVAGRLIWFSDYTIGSTAFSEALERNKGKMFGLRDLNQDIQTYYRSQTGKTQILPAYMKAQLRSGSGMGKLRHRISIAARAIVNGSILRLVYSAARDRFAKGLRSEFNSVVREPDMTKPFVYLPLGFQPERTTCPQGGIFHDQILVTQTLSAALPKGWELYVKEHPSQWMLRSKGRYNSARYAGYYKRLAAIPNVRLVPITTSSNDLISKARAIATITGTAGWETLFRLKRPIIFGYPWYLPVPLIHRVTGHDDVKQAFEEIQNGASIDESELFYVLKCFEEATLRGYVGIIRDHLGVVPFDAPVSREESMQSIAKVVLGELNLTK